VGETESLIARPGRWKNGTTGSGHTKAIGRMAGASRAERHTEGQQLQGLKIV